MFPPLPRPQNGFYGYTSIQASSFPKTSIVSETTLRKLPEEEKVRRLLPCRGVSVTLLGCRDEEDDDRARPPELLYAVTTGNENAALFNTLQVAVSILGQSKRIFFGMILTILRHYSPSMVSIAYCDTGREPIGGPTLRLKSGKADLSLSLS